MEDGTDNHGLDTGIDESAPDTGIFGRLRDRAPSEQACPRSGVSELLRTASTSWIGVLFLRLIQEFL